MFSCVGETVKVYSHRPIRIPIPIPTRILFYFTKKFRMHCVLNEVYLQNLFKDGVTFHDESNEGN